MPDETRGATPRRTRIWIGSAAAALIFATGPITAFDQAARAIEAAPDTQSTSQPPAPANPPMQSVDDSL